MACNAGLRRRATMYAFELERPSTIADAVAALAADNAQALGGGQTIIPTMKQRLAGPSRLVSLLGVSGLQGVSSGDGAVAVGGATTHVDVANGAASSYPALASLAANIGDPAVRNRGTIGGSLANNDPAADYPAAALGSGATIATNQREISAENFFLGLFETALENGEIITSVSFPVPKRASYVKFEQPASRFALVGVFVAQYDNGVRVAVTGAAEGGVFRWTEAEAALSSNYSAAAIDGLSTPSVDNLVRDLHGSAEYRAHLVKVLTKRAVASS